MPGRDGIEVTGPHGTATTRSSRPDALALVARLQRELGPRRRRELLAARDRTPEALSAGGTLDFLAETKAIRDDESWRVAPPAPGLVDRRVEITGPTDRKMTINALNSGAKVWLADFEDANTPLWDNMVSGQLNLRDAHRPHASTSVSDEGKAYQLRPDEELATIVVRPRGWHLDEKHLLVDGAARSRAACSTSGCTSSTARSGSSTRARARTSTCPRWRATSRPGCGTTCSASPRSALGIPQGTIRATVLIETYPGRVRDGGDPLRAARALAPGLNAGRWDYMFSIIKKFRTRGRDFVLPDRNAVTMTVPFMRAYTELLVRTCHKRGAHAIGGMAAFIPSRTRPGGQRGGAGEGARRQDPRGRRRLRRLVGGPPGPGPDLPRGVRRRARRPAEPARPAARGRLGRPRRPARRAPRPRARSPRPGCATTSASACSTSRPGCAAPARSASST